MRKQKRYFMITESKKQFKQALDMKHQMWDAYSYLLSISKLPAFEVVVFNENGEIITEQFLRENGAK